MGWDRERFPVLSSIEPVVAGRRWVDFHPEHLELAVRQWGHILTGEKSWDHPCHYFDGAETTVRWILVLDVLNHCFWPDPGETTWTVVYRGQGYSGYWGLAAGLKRAMEEGFPLTDPAYLAGLPEEDLRQIFAGEGEIPLFNQRLFNLRETGSIILSRWQGNVLHLFEEALGSAVRTVQQVVMSFPSFRDEAHFQGRKVLFWKRAQLLVADLHEAFSGNGWGRFDDIGKLTAFADYKLPQVLREMGILSYEPSLAARIDAKVNLPADSEEEVEIRALTIWAVEELKKEFFKLGKAVTSVTLDQWLWQLGQLEPFRKRPYHRCRTIYY